MDTGTHVLQKRHIVQAQCPEKIGEYYYYYISVSTYLNS